MLRTVSLALRKSSGTKVNLCKFSSETITRPPQKRVAVKEFPKDKIKEAQKLIQENPLNWTSGRLASHFNVPVSVINATVPRATRRERMFFRRMNITLPAWNPRPPRSPNQEIIDKWIQKQIDNTLVYKSKKKLWQNRAKYEVKQNRDLRWLKQIDFKLRKEQAKAEQGMVVERKLKAAAAASQ